MLATVVLTKNSQATLDNCLASLWFSDQIFVVDDHSNDTTCQIAASRGATVVSHPLAFDFSAQRNWALDQINADWILFVDSDEIVSDALAKEILNAIKLPSIIGFYLHRQDYLWGKKIKFGDQGQVKLLRLARPNSGRWQGKIHEKWLIKGNTATLHHPLLHYPHPTVSDFVRSLNSYSTIRAQELYTTNPKPSFWPILLYPPLKFFHLYLIKFGFLDGIPGFVSAMLMSFYTFLCRGKHFLLSRNLPA